MTQTHINEFVGKTFSKIDNLGDELIFHGLDGSKYIMNHWQNCCEEVRLEDICGDLSDLTYAPILKASEDISENITPEGITLNQHGYSYTWTFYNLATIKGSVNIRWYGESNGYYSESVNIEKVTGDE